MTRFVPLLIAALFATPGVAAGYLFDLPDLTFPQTDAPVMPSSSGAATEATLAQQG